MQNSELVAQGEVCRPRSLQILPDGTVAILYGLPCRLALVDPQGRPRGDWLLATFVGSARLVHPEIGWFGAHRPPISVSLDQVNATFSRWQAMTHRDVWSTATSCTNRAGGCAPRCRFSTPSATSTPSWTSWSYSVTTAPRRACIERVGPRDDLERVGQRRDGHVVEQTGDGAHDAQVARAGHEGRRGAGAGIGDVVAKAARSGGEDVGSRCQDVDYGMSVDPRAVAAEVDR